MITITLPKWLAIYLTIYLVLNIIANILNGIENKLNKEYRRQMNEFIEEERHRRWIKEWKESKGAKK